MAKDPGAAPRKGRFSKSGHTSHAPRVSHHQPHHDSYQDTYRPPPAATAAATARATAVVRPGPVRRVQPAGLLRRRSRARRLATSGRRPRTRRADPHEQGRTRRHPQGDQREQGRRRARVGADRADLEPGAQLRHRRDDHRRPGRHRVLRRVHARPARQRPALPADHDGAVRDRRADHRAGSRPVAARPALDDGRHRDRTRRAGADHGRAPDRAARALSVRPRLAGAVEGLRGGARGRRARGSSRRA